MATICISGVQAQQYSRISLTPIFLKHSSGGFDIEKVADSVVIPEKFDFNSIGSNIMSVPFAMISPAALRAQEIAARIQEIRDSQKGDKSLGNAVANMNQISALQKDLDEANTAAHIEDSIRNVQTIEAIRTNRIPNKILSYILIDPKLGYMTTDLIAKRAEYNASDADYIKAMNSETKMAAIRDKGQELLKNVYFILFDPRSRVATSTNKEKPELKRISLSTKVYLYKIDIDSLMRTGQFDPLIFTEPDSKKAEAFQQYDFPVKLIMTLYSGSSTDNYEIDSKGSVGNLLKAAATGGNNSEVKYIMLSDEVINEALVKGVYTEAEFQITQKYDPFKIKVPVFASNPIRAKIGLKESLKVDDLYKVTENRIANDGQISEVKIGWIRAKKVADNKKVADGKMEPSTFYKIASKNVQKGMKITQHPERGIVLGVGYNIAQDNIMSGPIFNVDYITHAAPGLRVGLGIGGFSKMRPSEVQLDDIAVDANILDFEGTNLYGEMSIQKIVQANRLEFTPYLGAYFSSLSIDKYYVYGVENKIEDAGDNLKGLANTTYGALGGAKIGFNLGKHTQINLGYKLGFQIGSDLKNEAGEEVTTSNYKKITMSFNSPAALTFGLRLYGF